MCGYNTQTFSSSSSFLEWLLARLIYIPGQCVWSPLHYVFRLFKYFEPTYITDTNIFFFKFIFEYFFLDVNCPQNSQMPHTNYLQKNGANGIH